MKHRPRTLSAWYPTNPSINTTPECGYRRIAPGPNAIIVDLAEHDSILAWTLNAAAAARGIDLLCPPRPDENAHFTHIAHLIAARIQIQRADAAPTHEEHPGHEARNIQWVEAITVHLTLTHGTRHLSAPATLSEEQYDQFDGVDVPLGVLSSAETRETAQHALETLWAGYSFTHDDPHTDAEEAYRAFRAECRDESIRAVFGAHAATEARLNDAMRTYVLPLLDPGQRLVVEATANTGIERLLLSH